MRKLTPFFTALNFLLIIVWLVSTLYALVLGINNYPLATYWSESWRIFSGATVFSPVVLGQSMPWPWLDPGRAVLDGLVLLIPGGQPWVFRAWQVFLILTLHLLTALAIWRGVWRTVPDGRPGALHAISLIIFGAMFLYQAPIYYHLLLAALLVLWFYDAARPKRTLLIIALASFWMGLCRVNWFLMPAVLAVTLYLLTTPVGVKNSLKYLAKPGLWLLVGGVTSFGTYLFYTQLTGYVIPFLNPEMRYGFFRFKLWPNEAFSLGLFPGILLLSIPIGVLIIFQVLKYFKAVHWLRHLLLVVILGIFFTGSTVVSLRAGGGYDLHNYDSFILLLLIVGAYWGMAAVALDRPMQSMAQALFNNSLVLTALMVVPVFFSLRSWPSSIETLPDQQAKAAIEQIGALIEITDPEAGPILMIDGRHLWVYDMLPQMEKFYPYEKVELMEMAMADYNPYLRQFQQDIAEQKFSLIVAEILTVARRKDTEPYGYENNVWSWSIAYPVLQSYAPVFLDREVGMAVYAPIVDVQE